jgi:AraC-like DNA-binding protein
MATPLKDVTPEIRSPLVAFLLASLRSPAAQQRARAQLGIFSHMLEAPLSAVPLAPYVALFEDIAARTRDPLFGARLGALQNAADALGPLGFLLLAAPTLRQGLGAVARHIGTWQTGTSVALQTAGEVAFWTYRIEDAHIWPRRQDAEYTLATMCHALQSRLGSAWRPVEVHFEHDEPACAPALRQLFGAPLRFRHPCNRLVLSLDELDAPYDTPFTCFVPYVEDYLRDLAPPAAATPDIIGQVRDVIRGALSHREISLTQVASTLQRSPRSLQRHLAAANTTLRQIVQDIRQEQASALLGTKAHRRTDIAHALGYADHTAFWRALRSWQEKGPGDAPPDP